MTSPIDTDYVAPVNDTTTPDATDPNAALQAETAIVGVTNMAQLQTMAPTLFQAIQKNLAQQILSDMKAGNQRLREIIKEGES